MIVNLKKKWKCSKRGPGHGQENLGHGRAGLGMVPGGLRTVGFWMNMRSFEECAASPCEGPLGGRSHYYYHLLLFIIYSYNII